MAFDSTIVHIFIVHNNHRHIVKHLMIPGKAKSSVLEGCSLVPVRHKNLEGYTLSCYFLFRDG